LKHHTNSTSSKLPHQC